MKALFTSILILAATTAYCQQEPKKPANNTPADIQIAIPANGGNIAAGEPADASIFEIDAVQLKPMFPGGDTEFGKLITANLPPESYSALTKGKHLIQTSFVVERDGTISDIQIAKDQEQPLVNWVIRAIKMVKKKWEPAINNAAPVRCRYNLSVEVTVL